MKECTKCKSNEYTNKSLVMLINECAHPLCRNCVDNLYARNAAPCHVCGRVLRKNTFWEQVFDDPLIEKENNVRKRLKKIFNLKEDDFPTLQDYNDYLEQFENYVFNLTNDELVEETEGVVNEFREANAELIEKNRKRLDEDQLWVLDQLKQEREQKKRIMDSQAADLMAANDKKAAIVDHKAIIDELKNSQAPAEQILDRERKRQIEAEMEQKEEAERKKRQQKADANRKRAADQISFSMGKRGAETGFVYRPPVIHINGPDLPPMDRLEELGYLQHMRAPRSEALAGGFEAALGAARALIEARVDLLIF
ncbi:hypothetical protein PMAYCL1PPCAC_04498 [Pristionchus mayeri]|uniref:RING-type domain-containing protein n=1 Tax=Pristionchus mayeri TaxID=1317129 RepID=A0AAN4Z994_9BILA|nr:hypothetical protein PMAYCL1PPCAC_04498 [Pristionchus mayeri]